MIAAHRLCTPTRQGRVVDPLVERARVVRVVLGLILTVGAWLAFGLVPTREIPRRFHESFAYGFSAVQMIVYVAWAVIAMAPSGRKWAAAVRWRGPVIAYVLTFTAFVVFMQSGLSDWPPASPWTAVCGLWLLVFGGYGGYLLISNGARTADINDALPAVLPSFAILAFSLPSLGDPMYDSVSMPTRLLLGLTGPVAFFLMARWELRRLRMLHGVRLSDMWRRA